MENEMRKVILSFDRLLIYSELFELLVRTLLSLLNLIWLEIVRYYSMLSLERNCKKTPIKSKPKTKWMSVSYESLSSSWIVGNSPDGAKILKRTCWTGIGTALGNCMETLVGHSSPVDNSYSTRPKPYTSHCSSVWNRKIRPSQITF